MGLAELGAALGACLSRAERSAAATRRSALAAQTAARTEQFRQQVAR